MENIANNIQNFHWTVTHWASFKGFICRMPSKIKCHLLLLGLHFVKRLDGFLTNEGCQLHAVLKVPEADIFEVFVWAASFQE